MLGNDIVDLADMDTKVGARHPRFDARVFSESERETIRCSQEPERTRWMLWAVKEAAYKAARRQRPETVFSPPRFRVELEAGRSGLVRHGDRVYSAKVEPHDDCIHAVVCDGADPDCDTLQGFARLRAPESDDPSCEVRALAQTAIAARLGIERSQLRIERTGRVPHLVAREAPLSAVLSLSHHGVYVGFACRLASGGQAL